jgi:hypothetical protein
MHKTANAARSATKKSAAPNAPMSVKKNAKKANAIKTALNAKRARSVARKKR